MQRTAFSHKAKKKKHDWENWTLRVGADEKYLKEKQWQFRYAIFSALHRQVYLLF